MSIIIFPSVPKDCEDGAIRKIAPSWNEKRLAIGTNSSLFYWICIMGILLFLDEIQRQGSETDWIKLLVNMCISKRKG